MFSCIFTLDGYIKEEGEGIAPSPDMQSDLNRASNKTLVSEIPLFQGMSQEALARLFDKLKPLKLTTGDILFEEGAEGNALYIVLSGRVSVQISVEEKGRRQKRLVDSLGRGEIVGEMSLITGEPRSATLTAVRDTTLLELDLRDFEAFFMQTPQAMKSLMAILATRLKETTRRVAQKNRATAFTLFPLKGFRPLKEFLAAFSSCFLSQTSARFIQRAEALRALNLKKIEHDCGLAAWLSEQEEKEETLFYLADDEDPLWTDSCLRQSDCVVSLGWGPSPPPPPTSPPFKETHSLQEELVLVFPEGSQRPPQTQAWRNRFSSSRCHLLRLSHPRDMGRLVRTLRGHAVGVVLGGGGARGFAHIGALRAFEELGIPIDRIGGTSMGALVAATHALELSIPQTIQIFRTFLIESAGLKDYTLPLFSLIRGKRVTRALQDLVQGIQIEDLWVPYFCVATNLTNAEKVLHRRGPLLEALLSSFAIPGLLPPVLKEGDLLVDGAFLDNLPVEAMRTNDTGPLIALNVSPVEDTSVQTTCARLPSPSRALFDKLNPFSKAESPPGLLSLLMRATTIGSVHQLEELRHKVDLLIEPSIAHFGLMDWERLDDIIEAGYQETFQQLQRWQESSAPASESRNTQP